VHRQICPVDAKTNPAESMQVKTMMQVFLYWQRKEWDLTHTTTTVC